MTDGTAEGSVSPHAVAPILTAEILSVGSELTVGETRDTNAGELARELSDEGVSVLRLTAVPDHLDVVTDAYRRAIGRADMAVSTGGLGPTPDDLTREAIAALCEESPAVDDRLESWLRELWFRRGMPFPEINLKQAWLIPSATAIPNRNGTAPGWWVERPGGRVIVALPGPPREMRPMWRDWVLPRLRERGLGMERVTTTLRLWGIGESQVADLLGEALLRAPNPVVATYARSDSVDVRISAVSEARRPAATIAANVERTVREALGDHIWATGNVRWPEAIGGGLATLGSTLAVSELGTGGAFSALFGEMTGLVRVVSTSSTDMPAKDDEAITSDLADAIRREARADLGLAIVARPHGGDTSVVVAISDAGGSRVERRVVFQGGPQGRSRAVLTAGSLLLKYLDRRAGGDSGASPRPIRQPEKVG
jgi:nicotinamide-nucleotide amidase